MAAILIVENDAQVRIWAESCLQRRGHRTFTASTIYEASAILHGPDRIDILLTDVRLRDGLQAGIKLARLALERRPTLRVLYTTGEHVTDGMRALFVERSAMLPKPYTVAQLLNSISMLEINHPPRSVTERHQLATKPAR